MSAQEQIVVVSPHLDDAALDCCEHIFAWKRSGIRVSILTVFTAFSARVLSPWARWYSGAADSGGLAEFERRRACEDLKAMNILGVSWNHLGFVAAGFRCNGGKTLYPDSEAICSGVISPEDMVLLNELKRTIRPLKDRSWLVVPFGIGKHVDHILVRKAAEEVVKPVDLYYYLDYPYALTPWNWTASDVVKVLTARKSIRWMSKVKRRLLNVYSSQIPRVFPLVFPRTYPEIIFCPRHRAE
jgi:LmbE family N-acetylglucosaminyl deacetylase